MVQFLAVSTYTGKYIKNRDATADENINKDDFVQQAKELFKFVDQEQGRGNELEVLAVDHDMEPPLFELLKQAAEPLDNDSVRRLFSRSVNREDPLCQKAQSINHGPHYGVMVFRGPEVLVGGVIEKLKHMQADLAYIPDHEGNVPIYLMAGPLANVINHGVEDDFISRDGYVRFSFLDRSVLESIANRHIELKKTVNTKGNNRFPGR